MTGKFAGSSEIINPMDLGLRRLPLPPEDETRRIFKETNSSRRRGAERWILKVPGDPPTRKVVAFYYPGKRILVRKIGGSHVLGNRPGIAWNLELLCRADHWHKRPVALIVNNEAPTAGGQPRQPYRVEWETVRRFAHAALEGDDRWLVTFDVDDQLLLPWPTWSGVWTGPPARKDDPDEPAPEQESLFELDKDPRALEFKHPA